MRKYRFLIAAIVIAVVGVGSLIALRSYWQTDGDQPSQADHDDHDHGHEHAHGENEDEHGGHEDAPSSVRLSSQARLNLALKSKPLELTTYSKRIEIPGVVTEFPGRSDHSVVAPIAGIVMKVHSHPGETLAHDAPLFSLRLVSESLHTSQRELFKATQDLEIAQQHRERLSNLAESGALAQSRLIEIDNQISRTNASIQAYRQELASRGLSTAEIDQAGRGEFITETVVRAPRAVSKPATEPEVSEHGTLPPETFSFELKELHVELGQRVEAGQLLCNLSDHRMLLIEGHGFKDDVPLIQQAAKNQLPIEVQFERKDAMNWPEAPREMRIHHVENTIDPETRTFHFDLILKNNWQLYENNGEDRILWRYRPGDRVRLFVSIEELKGVFVLPAAAVVREGAESYVFQQNGDLFERKPVHVLHQDQDRVAIASDASVHPGIFIAQNAAASLNRMLKAQSSSGMPAGTHVHADGTVHGAH